MQIIKNVDELRKAVRELRCTQPLVGLVPTMGFLHAGHLSLVRQLQERTTNVIVSIFVNPTQFNNPADFEKYPMDLDRDCQLLADLGTKIVFAPTTEGFYGDRSQFQSWVELSELSKPLEGASRPGHFRGVTTVVTMLFNAVQPDLVAFGEKDFQQMRQIEQMIADLKFPIELLRGPTVREIDGVAMSSRNVRLSSAEREQAVCISRGLIRARDAFLSGVKNSEELLAVVNGELNKGGLRKIDYVSLVNEQTLADVSTASAGDRILVAVHLGEIRLIDNIQL